MSEDSDYSLADREDSISETSKISIPVERHWNDDTIDASPGSRRTVESHWYDDPLRRHDLKMCILIVSATILILILIPMFGILAYKLGNYYS